MEAPARGQPIPILRKGRQESIPASRTCRLFQPFASGKKIERANQPASRGMKFHP
jgi:hypothetical protein